MEKIKARLVVEENKIQCELFAGEAMPPRTRRDHAGDVFTFLFFNEIIKKKNINYEMQSWDGNQPPHN